MADAGTLELTSLLTRHPERGEYLLFVFGSSCLHRLRVDPTPVASGELSREVAIEFKRSPGDGAPVAITKRVGWSQLPIEVEALAAQAPGMVNAHRLSEDSAIAMMALFLSELEQLTLKEVIQIGDGADYLVRGETAGNVAVEVSGIRQADYPSQSHGRVREKTEELLRLRDAGHVSVTTFSLGQPKGVYSVLHFVKKAQGTEQATKKGKKKQKGSAVPPATEIPEAAGKAVASAGIAFAKGDTEGAARGYRDAGALFREHGRAMRGRDRAWAHYLAASQFFQGGAYREAVEMARHIRTEDLSERDKESVRRLAKKARERSLPSYIPETKSRLRDLALRNDYRGMLQLLQDHPYVVDRTGLAFLRAVSCHHLRDYPGAAAFFATARRFMPQSEMDFVTIPAGQLMQLVGIGQIADALAYSTELHRFLPHPITTAGAAIVHFFVARNAGKEADYSKQLSLFQDLRKGMAANQQLVTHLEAGPICLLAYETAMLASIRRGEDERAVEIGEEGLQWWPGASGLYEARGLAREPGKGAEEDFARSVDLGTSGYIPYYFLSLTAFRRGEFSKAVEWGEAALARVKPHEAGRARLLAWVAGCIEAARGDHAYVERLYREALEVDPHDKEIRSIFESFMRGPASLDQPLGPSPDLLEEVILGPLGELGGPRTNRLTRQILQPA